jgi:thiosulfate dehydrogenase
MKALLLTFTSFTLIILVSRAFGTRSETANQVESKNRKLPEGPLGETIKLGEELIEKTASHELTKPYSGNALNCRSCHLKNGQDPKAATFLGVATAYPAWSPREGRVISLEDRILNCFMRSCNGIRPPLGSKVSIAMTAYITWLSSGEQIQMNLKKPSGPNALHPLSIKMEAANIEKGEKLYFAKCASCHAKDGEGKKGNPPVWGKNSYNRGAGFSSTDQLAAWLKVAMPLDEADLTEEEAVDIAGFVNSKQRSEFDLQHHLPPNGKLGEYNAESERPKN